MIQNNGIVAYLLLFGAIILSAALVHTNYAKAELIVGVPTNLGPPVNSLELSDSDPEISADGLTLYFKRGGPPGFGTLMVTQRASLASPWASPVPLPALSTAVRPGEGPTVTDDHLLMYFFGDANGQGNSEIYESSRISTADLWGPPVNVGAPVNSAFRDRHPSISGDGLTLYFVSNRDNPTQSQLDIYVATRESRNAPFGVPAILGDQVNSKFNEGGVEVSSDGLLLLFHSDRDGVPTDQDIFYAERSSISDPWSPAQKLGPTVNSLKAAQGLPSISKDGRFLYYGATIDPTDFNTSDLYVVEIIPEPATLALVFVGASLCACTLVGRRRAATRLSARTILKVKAEL